MTNINVMNRAGMIKDLTKKQRFKSLYRKNVETEFIEVTPEEFAAHGYLKYTKGTKFFIVHRRKKKKDTYE